MSILEILDAACKHLSVEDRGVLVTAILNDIHGEEVTFSSPLAEYAFNSFKDAIKEEQQRIERIAETHRRCGRLGGRPRKNQKVSPQKPKGFSENQKVFCEKPNDIKEDFNSPLEVIDIEIDNECVSEDEKPNKTKRFLEKPKGFSDLNENFNSFLGDIEYQEDSKEDIITGEDNKINTEALDAILNSTFERENEEKKKSNIKENKEDKDKERKIKESETFVSEKKKKKVTKKNPVSVFKPPTVQEVAEYCQHRGNSIDAEYFVAFYNARGWMAGESQTPITNWKAQVIIWEKNNITTENNGNRHSATNKNGNLDNREREYESSF